LTEHWIHSARLMERIIVRRGRFLTYELLRRTFGDDPNVEIMWDRRRSADGTPRDRDIPERRSPPPAEWDRLDYIFTSGIRPKTTDSEPPAS
jgi:hypothetical protein